MNLLSGVALITGASSGIGLAIAEALAKEKMTLLLTGRDRARLEEVAVRLRSPGGQPPQIQPADLSSDDDLRILVEWAGAQSRGLDVLVHSAGSIHLGNIETVGWADLDSDYRVNLRAPFLLTKALLPLLRTSGGQVVFVNSSAGLAAGADNGLYAATKHGLRSLAGSIRDAVNPHGVRVLSVFPGRTATPMQETVTRFEQRTYRPEELLQPSDVAAMVVAALGLPRTAEVMDLVIRPMKKPSAAR